MKDKLVPKLPLLSMIVVGIISLFFSFKGIFNYTFLMSGQFMGAIPSFILFGDSTQPSFIFFVLSSVWLIAGWLVSTKFKEFQKPVWRFLWYWNVFFGIAFHYLWLISAPIYNSFLPYLGNRILEMEVDNIWHAVAVGDTNTLLVTLMFVPSAVTFMILLWLAGRYSQYSNEIKAAFNEFEYKNYTLQKWFKLANKEHWPDVILGHNSKTKEVLVQPGRDRTLNNAIIGSIGTGKTAALVLPILNQDLHWMSRFINDYPKIYNRQDYHTEKVLGMYLNGISVIEPSNDLCQKAYQLVLAHGIPKESVYYIDPTNPETPSINPMQGPVDKVAEAFAMVIQGLAEGGNSNFFFEQSERNHLKHYIYLLKLHVPGQEVTFDMLLNMYNNPQLVRRMHVKLKGTIPANLEQIEGRDDRNHWAIVKQIDEWFDMNLLVKQVRVGGGMSTEKITHGEYRGEDAYFDAKAEHVQGLRNVLNDIGASPLIRRVLFGKSTFDFDRHLEMGGVLLVNTAKGELGGLSNILGKLILLSLQNAVFRRKPNVSSFHHILVDEFADYIYQPFREFPAQSRKYKTIITVVAQTVTQLADRYSETYMHTLLGTLRHKMVYGDIPDFDAQLFSKIFGEKEKFEEGVSEQAVSPLQETPSLRVGSNFTKVKEAILSPSEIIYQKPFQCAVKIVANNKPIPVQQIDANFVPNEEFKNAKIQVDEDAARIWLLNRNELESPAVLAEDFDEETVQPDISEQSREEAEEHKPLGYVRSVEHPIHYEKTPTFKDSVVTEHKEDEEPNNAKPVTNPIDITPVQEEVSRSLKKKESNPSDDELEEFDWATAFGGNAAAEPVETDIETKSTEEQAVENKPKKSELGEKQLGLIDDVLKEVDKVPSQKEAAASLYEDYE
ncbi:conjugal transfer protein TraG [Fictibacillus phosphorivorans]|uniref:Conjugal transfer protein TraG n=1 Tax=Fictibacillus phosphorivorans TaxID=1221500 RepID=A0A165NXB2_9BACL|nr:type IV secretory system conjugative DNA transfer family protein [Fictibacillus phosphorivorans]KZE68033.1 conjugal transfer protein TraG [Fictibacillus phosphorivorans]